MANLRHLIVPLLGAQLSGCLPGASLDTGLERYSGLVEALMLKNPLRIPAGKAHTLFQGGRQVSGVNRSELYCEFEINTVSEQPQQVERDRFVIRNVSYRILSDELAGIPAFIPIGGSCWDDVYYETRWWLQSERQPGVRVLICREMFPRCRAGWFPAADTVALTLGPVFELTVAAPEVVTPDSPGTSR